MKLENIKSEEDVSTFINGCLNDMDSMVSTKVETCNNIHRLIIFIIKKDRRKRKWAKG